MDTNLILASIGVFLVIIMLLVVILLVAKRFLVSSGNVTITINDKDKLEVESGNSLLSTLTSNGVFLPSACGGKGSCGQCKCQVLEGGGDILPSEKGHFSRKQQLDNWRLGCQVKVTNDLKIKVPESVMGVKEYECTVISNKNVATFIKEFKVQLPEGAHMDFLPGSYSQIRIPHFDAIRYADFDKELNGKEDLPSWEKFKTFDLVCKNPVPPPWPTIPPRVTSSCSPCVSQLRHSSPIAPVSWRSTLASRLLTSSRSSLATRL